MIIPCLNCGGKKFIIRIAYDGMHYPIKCKGCDGTGRQVVK